ncbi:MAG: DUF302 domain-containing protein [Pseudomonadota bacterium]
MTRLNFSKPVRALLIILVGTILPMAAWSAEGMTVVTSEHDVAETEERLVAALEEKGFTIMARVNHAAGAHSVDLELEPTRLVIFGNPAGGTLLMQCRRGMAIDLPMKMLIWRDGDEVQVAYNSAEYLADRHDLGDCAAPVQEKMGEVLDGLARRAADL